LNVALEAVAVEFHLMQPGFAARRSVRLHSKRRLDEAEECPFLDVGQIARQP
jgi:hypothetical protein